MRVHARVVWASDRMHFEGHFFKQLEWGVGTSIVLAQIQAISATRKYRVKQILYRPLPV